MASQQQPVIAVHHSETRRQCARHALVLEAVGIDYGIRETADGFTLVVSAGDALQARAELDAFALENRDRRTEGDPLSHRTGGWGGVVGYAAVLLLVCLLQRQHALAADWMAAGSTQAGLIRQGQWWRAVTALCLHIDLAHLMANLIIGGLVGLFAGQLLGSGLAWMTILIGGTTGNLLNAWIRQPEHTSVGASTAVFAALGIVATYVWKRRGKIHASGFIRWAPVIAGVILLSYLGTGGLRTDVGAHVAGFLSGALLGALLGTPGGRFASGAGAQWVLGLGALAILTLAWALALSSPGPPSVGA
ncbi:MAG: rhomboid family intramembrane serine protease [Phycisphaerae bacterium]